MGTMRKLLLSLLLLLNIPLLCAVNLRYKVSSWGLSVADLQIDLAKGRSSFRVKSKANMLLFPHIDNSYLIYHDDNYNPLRINRIVHQSELQDSICTTYVGNRATMHQKSTGESISYNITRNTRDVFCLILAICNDNEAEGIYLVDGNGRTWHARVSSADIENISTALGKQTARKHEISFEPLTSQKAPYTDMLTFNFLNPDVKLNLWISLNGFPLKAKLKKSFVGMNWDILSITK